MSSNQTSDFSMNILQAAGVQLATHDVAIGLAELLIKSSYGEKELELQKPLTAKDGGDRWIVEGSRNFGQSQPEGDDIDLGKIVVEIAKPDCRVLKITGDAKFRSPN